MITVNIIANGADLSLEQPTIAEGSTGGMTVCFCTDSLWHGLALTAVFHTQSGDILMPLNNGKCSVPYEATETCGDAQIGLFGTDGYRTLTSVFCPFTVSPGVPTDGEHAMNYTPSLYEQFAARFDKVENFTVSAEEGDAAAVARSENENGINLHFTIPKGKQGDNYVLTENDKEQIASAAAGAVSDGLYLTDDFFENEPLFAGIINFKSEEEYFRFKNAAEEFLINDNAPYYFGGANTLFMVNGSPYSVWIMLDDEEENSNGAFYDFTLPEAEKEKLRKELKAYVDETLLGGAW